ncbi:hypothetical protein [Sphingobacterium cellulitidis]|uniref:hypothetical protein n=1 Tax=Sphingobacterium cellulitidis TaxID=1768011 RepID=UPI00114062F5
MKKILFLITLCFCFTYTNGQNKIAVGSFTINNKTFYVSNSDYNPDIFVIKTGKFSNGNPKNPDFIDNISIESVMGAVTVYDYRTYYSYLENLPNYNSLKNNHDWIDVFFVIDGNADILDLSFIVSKATVFTPSNIAGLYKYILDNVHIRLKSPANAHLALKYFGFFSYYKFSNNLVITRGTNN